MYQNHSSKRLEKTDSSQLNHELKLNQLYIVFFVTDVIIIPVAVLKLAVMECIR